VNYFDPHYPYEPPRGFDTFSRGTANPPSAWVDSALEGQPPSLEVQDALIARYDDEIAAMDFQLGRLLDAWRKRTGGQPTLVIVTADHGESFGEEGFYLHNGSLGEEATRIPLLIQYPDGRGAGTSDDRPVQLVDVLPIVASAVDIELPGEVQGVLPGERVRAYLELLRNSFRVKRFGDRYDHDLEALIDWPHKLVVADREDVTLYRVDGMLKQPMRAADASSVERLVADLTAHRERVGEAQSIGRAELDAETVESLRALGYL
jgi:arylsulfatase A-like enzyme